MDYFLEICQKKHEFCVPHTKLFEYGIMSENSDSNDVKRRLDKLNLKNDMHYRLRKVPEPVNQGGYSTKNIYMLKPKAFKKLLMRAGKNSKQTIDVEIYADYYLLLEDVYVDYTGYERGYNKKVKDMLKQDKSILLEKMNNLLEMNQTQNNLIETQSGMIATQSSQLTEQSSRMDQLLKFAEDTKEELHEVKLELIDIKAQLVKLISAVVSLAYMPNIYKRFYERDHCGKKVRDGKKFSLTSVGKTKTLVFVATYNQLEKQLKIECVNRKLSEPLIQINKIIERAQQYNNNHIIDLCADLNIAPINSPEIREQLDDKFSKVLMPQAYGISSINEQEVRSTFSRLNKKSSQFRQAVDEYEVSDITWNTKFKAMILKNVESFEIAQYCFDKFISANQEYNIHSYDQSLELSIKESGELIAPEALDELKRRNIEFVDNSKNAIDLFYQRMYVCDNNDTTGLRIRRNPRSTLIELKNSVRDLVIDGINFD